MRSALTLVAAVAINLTALAVLEWEVARANLPPAGEVTIAQIEEPSVLAPLAQVDGQVGRTSKRSL